MRGRKGQRPSLYLEFALTSVASLSMVRATMVVGSARATVLTTTHLAVFARVLPRSILKYLRIHLWMIPRSSLVKEKVLSGRKASYCSFV